MRFDFGEYLRQVKEDVKHSEDFEFMWSMDDTGRQSRIVKLAKDQDGTTVYKLIAEVRYNISKHGQITRSMILVDGDKKTKYYTRGRDMAAALHEHLTKAGLLLATACHPDYTKIRR